MYAYGDIDGDRIYQYIKILHTLTNLEIGGWFSVG